MPDRLIFAVYSYGLDQCIALRNKIISYSAVKTSSVVLNALRQAQGDIRDVMLSLSKHFPNSIIPVSIGFTGKHFYNSYFELIITAVIFRMYFLKGF